MKLFCKRSRYLIETNDEDGEGSVIDSEFTDGKNTNNNNSKSGDDSIDNDYLITLDSDIMTTNRSQYVNDLTFLNEEELNQLDVSLMDTLQFHRMILIYRILKIL